MRIEQVKRRQKVVDRWYPEWGIGWVRKVLKTKVHLLFADGAQRTYDKAHIQFLEPASRTHG